MDRKVRLSTASTFSRAMLLVVAPTIMFNSDGALAFPTPSFMGLGDLPSNIFRSEATGVSANGDVVVGIGTGTSGPEAFRWTRQDGIRSIGDLPGGSNYSEAFGVSKDGLTVVGRSGSASSGSRFEAFRWMPEGGMMGLGDLPGGAFSSVANGISDDGQVIVGSSITNHGIDVVEATIWVSDSGPMSLGTLPGNTGSFATSASGEGEFVVGGVAGGLPGKQAFRWSATTGMVGLGRLPGGTFSEARDVSADGSIVVGISEFPATPFTQSTQAMLWSEEAGMIGLGDLPGGSFLSMANAVSADGQLVVGQSSIARLDFPCFCDVYDTFLWDAANGMRSLKGILSQDFGLDLTGWELSAATAISPDGTAIVGRGINPNGNQEAWLAIIPEPASVFLICVGAYLVGCLNRLRRARGSTKAGPKS